jgi:hypothetical protein
MRWFEKQRIEFIGLTMQTIGIINRKDIQNKFNISVSQAHNDLQTYKRIHKKWGFPPMKYNANTKRYERKDYANAT